MADRLSEAPASEEESVRAAAIGYRDSLAAAGVSDAVVAPGAGEALLRRSRLGWLLTFALAPLAVIGLVANAVPVLAVDVVGRRPMPPVTHATAKFLTAIVLFPASWALLRWFVFDVTAHPWLLTLAVGPVCGLAALWCVGRAIRARRARLGLRRLAAASGLVQDLRARRAHLVDTVRAARSGPTRETDDRRGQHGAGSLDLQP